MRAPFFLAVALPAALTFVACGSEHVDEDPDVEGCEHLAEGPFTPVTATSASTGAPAVAADHMAYTVSLPAAAIGNSGFVAFAADEAEPYIFYVDQNVTVAFSDSSGAAVTPTQSSTSAAACTDIQGRHVVPLEVGTAFVLLSSPTVSSVNVVVEHALTDHEH